MADEQKPDAWATLPGNIDSGGWEPRPDVAGGSVAPGPDAELEEVLPPEDLVVPPHHTHVHQEDDGSLTTTYPSGRVFKSAPDPERALEFRPQVQCHHGADRDGHRWDPLDGDCPSQPHAYVPVTPEAERSQKLELPPLPDGQVGVEIDFVLTGDETLEQAIEADKGTWAIGCNLELVQENGPAGGNAVLRLSGPPEAVKGALIRYCGGDSIEAAHLYGPGFTEHSATVTPGGN